jgi:probable phosphoglycerate mutase
MDAAAAGAVFTPVGDRAEPSQTTSAAHPLLGWSGLDGVPTKLLFLRHGETQLTADRRFSGPGGDDPGLIDSGIEQARRAARAIVELGGVDVLVSSPMRRTRETAEAVSASLGIEVVVDDGFRECAFGAWDGLTFAEVERRWPRELAEWLASPTVCPPGGESVADVRARVEASLLATLEKYREQTVVVVSHVTPIKVALRYCLQGPWEITHHMLLAPGSLTTMWFYESGASVLRHFSVVP